MRPRYITTSRDKWTVQLQSKGRRIKRQFYTLDRAVAFRDWLFAEGSSCMTTRDTYEHPGAKEWLLG